MRRQSLELRVEVFAEGLQVPEGPVWLPDGTLLVVEILGQRLSKISPDGRVETVAELPGGPNGAALGPDGWIYICNNGASMRYRMQAGLTTVEPQAVSHPGGSIQRVHLSSGRVETLHTQAGGRRLESPNDLVFDQQGGLWFTDYGVRTPLGRTYGSICYVAAGAAEVQRVRDYLVSPNGIALSPDQKILYVGDTTLGRIWSFPVTLPGTLGPAPFFQPGTALANLHGGERVDSLAVEESGRVCVATIGDGGIAVVESDGSAYDFLKLPDPFITNLCFGGPDMQDVWITASGTGRIYRTRWPRRGLRLSF